MIEGRALVVATEDEWLLLEPERASACGHCSAAAGCGSGALASFFARRGQQMRLRNTIGAGVGDLVVLGVEESALLRGSIMVYLLPLLTMLIAALIAEPLATAGSAAGEWPVILAALAGLGAGFAAIAISRRGDSTAFQPTLLRRETPPPAAACVVELSPRRPI